MYKKSNVKNIKTFKEIDKEELDKLSGGWGLTSTNVAVETEVIALAAGVVAVVAAVVPD